MIRMELHRIMHRPMVWFLFAASIALGLWPVIHMWPHNVTADFYVLYPRSAYVSWMYFSGETYYIYALIFPLLATLIYSDAYAEDFNTGLIKNILTRIEKKSYLAKRFVMNFLMGGGMAIVPLLINFLAQMLAYPLIENNYFFGMVLVTENSFWPDLFYQNPMAYVIVRLFLLFLLGGTISSTGLAFSTMFKNRYIIVILPFLLILGLDVFFNTLGIPSISQIFLWNVKANWAIGGFLGIGFVFSFILFFYLGEKNETI